MIQFYKFHRLSINYYQINNTKKMRNKSKTPQRSFKGPKQERVYDLSKQDNFLFNKTPILASALQRLKKNEGSSKGKKKESNNQNLGVTPQKHRQLSKQANEVDTLGKPTKRVKKSIEEAVLPSFAYTPLQKDLYSFYTINKISLKTIQSVPEPKFEVGSLILTSICDRGIGGKYLVANLFRNKKGYIDYKEISQSQIAGNKNFKGIEAYQQPGNFVVATVVKSINQNNLQLSLSKFIELDLKILRIGQVIPAEIKSKQQLGCHLTVYKCNDKNYKFFLPKADIDDEQIYQELTQNTQIIVTITQIQHSKSLIKVKLASEEHTGLNLKGVQEEQMSKLQLEQYVSPGTLLNNKVIKILKNGVMVKFLKIFVGFIHVDHLENNLQFYSVDTKIEARIIYSCLNPPLLYLSEKHKNLNRYVPKRPLYSAVNKPENLALVQGSYLNKEEQFFVHPTQLQSQIDNVSKFWVKQNNYFERYQIMSSRKLGLRVGEVAKQIPFNNFKIYAQGDSHAQPQGNKFKVMCLDVWNKVVKISHDEKFIKSTNMLIDLQDVDLDKQYCGIIRTINDNGIIVEFCNNYRGILPKNELKMQQMQINEANINNKSIQVYINHIKSKKSFMTLSLVPPTVRNKGKTAAESENQRQKKSKNGLEKQAEETQGQQTYQGTIASLDCKSIHPIYVKLKSKLVKISIFNGIRPASVNNLPIIQDLASHYQVGQKVRVFRKGKQYFLYPPEQLSDKNLRICKVAGQKGSILRLQTGKSQFKNCHICDITDIITAYPFAELNIGQFKIGRVLNNGMICLRDSIVMNGIPKSMIQCKQKYHNDELRGDYRNRILTVGSAGLKQNMVLFGYIKNFTQKGCFVSVSNDFEVRVQMCELTDEYIADKAKLYPPNKLMLVRLVSQKVKPNDPTKHLFDASGRQSVVKMGYPINQQALMVGLTVSGKVSGYTKGKALIKLDGSKFTGIMNPSEVQGINKEEPIQKSMKLGTSYTMKIIELANQGRRLIRLSTLSKYFTKYKGVQLNFENDANSSNLWENYQQMLQQEPPTKNIQIGEMQHEQENEQDQYERIKNLIDNEFDDGNEEGDDEQKQNPENDEQQEDDNEDEQMGQDDESDDQMKDQASSSKNIPKSHGLEQNLSKQQVNRRLSQFRKMNNTSQIYQSILLANDSSESHLQYISSMISNPNVNADQIREQFMKSISVLQTIKDKENMWIAWLNMELILGDFLGLVKKAISSDAGLNVYNRIVQIMREQDKWDVALQMARKMLKKFNNDPRAYISMLKHMVLEQIHTKKQSLTLRQLLQRASQCLKSKDLVMIESHYGKILYQEKKPEEARTVFSNILTKNPKRTDLWSMYIDLEIKHGSIEKARQVFERCLSIKLKRKKIISILKKYHQFQQTYGSAKSAAQVLERAQKMAVEYENQRQQESDDD